MSPCTVSGEGNRADLDDGCASFDISTGKCLKEDLEIALNGDFDFKGSFSHGTYLPEAPNPCLNIEGLGPIGLPLSPRDAKSVIECLKQSPFGHGDCAVADDNIRNTWEIEPTRIKFDNPAWDPFVKTTVVSSVQHALGAFTGSLRCEFYKLLLCETGSHILPHKDIERIPGLFATIVIILPSLYTGGQVHVSHESTTNVLDISSTSPLSTSVLAWHTYVAHEVKPITSGYRLALSYNLVHASPGIRRPMLPGALAKLRHVLRKWRKNAYKNNHEMIVCLLAQQYSAVDMSSGEGALKGEDAHRIANLKTAAEDLGYMIYLANLSYKISGYPDAECDCGHRSKRGRYCRDAEEMSDSMAGEHRSVALENVVDLEGNSRFNSKDLNIEEDDLIPDNPFKGVKPDKEEHVCDDDGSLHYWYHRAALVLVHKNNIPKMLFSMGGVECIFSELEQSTSATPTADDRKMAKVILDHLHSYDTTTAVAMADYSIKWKDLGMWNTVIEINGSPISTFDVLSLVKAWKTFSFEGVRTSFEKMLLWSTHLHERLKFIQALSPHISSASPEEHELFREWSHEQTKQALLRFNAPVLEDIAALIAVASAGVLLTKILPQLAKNTSVFAFCVAFAKSLHDHRKSIVERLAILTPDQEKESEDFDSLIEQCLDISAMQWKSVVARPFLDQFQTDPKITRITDVVEACLLTAIKFQTFYGPLIPRLRSLLQTHKIDICSFPFSDLLQSLIGMYLCHILGARPQNARANIRKIGCGCTNCNAMDDFITSDVVQRTFRPRVHIEQQLASALDLVTFNIVRQGILEAFRRGNPLSTALTCKGRVGYKESVVQHVLCVTPGNL